MMSAGKTNMLGDRGVFFITSKPPFPPDDGQKIPVANYYEMAQDQGADPRVIVLKKGPVKSFRGRLGAVLRRMSPFGGFYSSERLCPEDAREIAASQAPLVFVTPARLLPHVARLKTDNKNLRIVLLLNDAKWPMYLESFLYGVGLRAGGTYQDLLKGMLTPITYLKELTAYTQADVVVMQNERERSKLGWLRAKSLAAMNAIPAPTTHWHGAHSTVLTMQVNFTNRRAKKWRPFIETVWPQIRERHPEMILQLFGPGFGAPPDWVRDAAGVEYIGRVEDLDAHLAGCRMLLMPLEHSTGVSNMVLHGVAMDMPMMISGTAEGGVLELLKGRRAVFVAHKPQDQVARILEGLDLDHTASPLAIGSWRANFDRILQKVMNEC